MKRLRFRVLSSLVFFSLLGNLCVSQSLAPEVLSGCSSQLSQSNGMISFTVGEVSVLTYTDANGNTLSGGFSAGAVLTVTLIEEASHDLITLNVYPNPTSDFLNLQVVYSTVGEIFISISDVQGKSVFSGKYAGIPNVIGINSAPFGPGAYILDVKNSNGEVLGKYKVVKF